MGIMTEKLTLSLYQSLTGARSLWAMLQQEIALPVNSEIPP
jgi:hypothetical protein